MTERLLVNFFYAPPVGHAIEALHYAFGHHLADPDRDVAVALSAATPVELADWCPFLTASYPVDHPLFDPAPGAPARIPPDWDWIVDDGRRHQPDQRQLFPGMAAYYAASDEQLTARRRRSYVGDPRAGYVPHSALRLDLPAPARARARGLLGGGQAIAVLPAGGGDPALYPLADSWLTVLDALAGAHPGARFVLVGKTVQDGRTVSRIGGGGLDRLRAHRTDPVDAVDLPLVDQLALVEACGVLVSPHSGFGMAALAVGTPWLSIAGGRWFEYFHNRVPFRSVVPDTARFPAYPLFGELPVGTDADGSPRTPSMTGARIAADLDRIVTAAGELLAGTVPYEQALVDYYRDLVPALGGADAIFSIDAVHTAYVS